jgi:hypothetical protein
VSESATAAAARAQASSAVTASACRAPCRCGRRDPPSSSPSDPRKRTSCLPLPLCLPLSTSKSLTSIPTSRKIPTCLRPPARFLIVLYVHTYKVDAGASARGRSQNSSTAQAAQFITLPLLREGSEGFVSVACLACVAVPCSCQDLSPLLLVQEFIPKTVTNLKTDIIHAFCRYWRVGYGILVDSVGFRCSNGFRYASLCYDYGSTTSSSPHCPCAYGLGSGVISAWQWLFFSFLFFLEETGDSAMSFFINKFSCWWPTRLQLCIHII